MQAQDPEAIRAKIAELRLEHRDMDHIISVLSENGVVDPLQIQRLKKRKLVLKDMIIKLESQLIPDLDA